MELRILAVGDVVGDEGVGYAVRRLPELRRRKNISFTVVNGENAAGLGILPRQAEELFAAGADVITLGNHTWNKRQIFNFLEENPYILRPANFSKSLPGRGFLVLDMGSVRIGVLNLIGRYMMDYGPESPFLEADRLLKALKADLILVDFHAEATSEKLAMGHYLDGRVAAVWGTHTHVPTADGQVLPKGTGYQTDLGMTGPRESVLGIRPEQSVTFFLGGLPGRYEAAPGLCKLEGCVFTVNTDTGLCTGVERIAV
ncbi:MAG: TIGR00282 family metallophosphoesterase [Oscillospiraceae bacterium]|nr:TIGR00282 family metallophosphoesterase [Oscillospiraceae bacterium]